MSSGVTLHAFNWDAFQKLVTENPTRLSEAVVEIMRELGCDEELPDLFEADFGPLEKVKSVFSSHNWYSEDHGLDEYTLMDLPQRIFEAELPELEVDTLTDGINFGLLRVVTGEVIVNPNPTSGFSFQLTNKTAQDCAQHETHWLGGRPFVGFTAAGEVVSNQTEYDDEFPYSIHTPAQVQQLFKEVQTLEEASETWHDEDLADNYMTYFLEPLEVAANNHLAIFAVSDT